MVDRLGQQLGELLVVEDLEAAAAGDLAHGGGVEAVVVVAVAALDEDAGVAEALGVHLSPDVVQVHTWSGAQGEATASTTAAHPRGRRCTRRVYGAGATFADVPAGVLDGGVAVDVGQQAEAEAVLVVRGVGEAVHQHAGGGGVVGLAHAVVELVVDDGAPVAGLLVLHRLYVWGVVGEEQSVSLTLLIFGSKLVNCQYPRLNNILMLQHLVLTTPTQPPSCHISNMVWW